MVHTSSPDRNVQIVTKKLDARLEERGGKRAAAAAPAAEGATAADEEEKDRFFR
jgi:hypothetical protein